MQSENYIIIEKFVERWGMLIEKIETVPMTNNELNTILSAFDRDVLSITTNYQLMSKFMDTKKTNHLQIFMTNSECLYDKIIGIRSRLIVACNISLAKWNDKHPSWFGLIASKLKVPDFLFKLTYINLFRVKFVPYFFLIPSN